MRIGVLSDTHLYHVTKEFRDIYNKYLSDTDYVLHAGDVVSAEVVSFLGKKNFHGVCGNMDPADVRNILPEKKIIEIEGYRIGLIHGRGSSFGLEERIRYDFEKVDVIVYGHSHIAVNHEREGILFFNPGTATGFSSADFHSIGILELRDTIHGEIVEL